MFIKGLKIVVGLSMFLLGYFVHLGLWSAILMFIGGPLFFSVIWGKHKEVQKPVSTIKTKTSNKKIKTDFPTIRGYIGGVLFASSLIFVKVSNVYKLFEESRGLAAFIVAIIAITGIVLCTKDWVQYKQNQPISPHDDYDNWYRKPR